MGMMRCLVCRGIDAEWRENMASIPLVTPQRHVIGIGDHATEDHDDIALIGVRARIEAERAAETVFTRRAAKAG